MGKGLSLMEGSGRMVGLPPHWSGKGVQERDRPWWEWAALFSTGEKGQLQFLVFKLHPLPSWPPQLLLGWKVHTDWVPPPPLC